MKKLLVMSLLVSMMVTACGKSDKKSEVIDTVISKEEGSTEYSTAGETIASIVQDTLEVVEQTFEQDDKDIVSTANEDHEYKFISTESFLEDIKTGYIDVDTVASDEMLTDEFIMSIGLGYIVLDDILVDEGSWSDFATMLCEEDELLPEYLYDFKYANEEVEYDQDILEEQVAAADVVDMSIYSYYNDGNSGQFHAAGFVINYEFPSDWRTMKVSNTDLLIVTGNGTEIEFHMVGDGTWKDFYGNRRSVMQELGVVNHIFGNFSDSLGTMSSSIKDVDETEGIFENCKSGYQACFGSTDIISHLPAAMYHFKLDDYYSSIGMNASNHFYLVARRKANHASYSNISVHSIQEGINYDWTSSAGQEFINDINNENEVLRSDLNTMFAGFTYVGF